MDVSCKCSVPADESFSILPSDKSTLELLYPNIKNTTVLVPISMIIGAQQLQGRCSVRVFERLSFIYLVFKEYSYSFH